MEISKGTMSKNKVYKQLLLLVLLLMIVALSLASPFFLSWKNGFNILNQSSIHLILSVGMTMIICAGGIDLSVGSTMAFSGVVTAMALASGLSAGLAIGAGLITGLCIGLVNGVMVSWCKINPFIVTLSMMSILRGVTVLVTDGRPIYGFDQSFTFWGSGGSGFLAPPVWIAIVAAILGILILEKTKLGNYCFFLGSNEKALERSGVNTKIYKTVIFGIGGLCAAISGMIVTARLNTADPLAGSGYEMDAIAAVILGGTLIQGGRGSVGGTVIACLILNVMKNGLTMLSISSNYQQVLTGVIVLVSVIISQRKRKGNEVNG